MGMEQIKMKYKKRGTIEKIRLIKIPNGRKIRILFSNTNPTNKNKILMKLSNIINLLFWNFNIGVIKSLNMQI